MLTKFLAGGLAVVAIAAGAAPAAATTPPPPPPPPAAVAMPMTPPRPITDGDLASLAVEASLYSLNEPGSMVDLVCPVVQADRVNARMRELGMSPTMTGYRFDVLPITAGPQPLICGPDPATTPPQPNAPFVAEVRQVGFPGPFADYVRNEGLTEPVVAHPDPAIGGEYVIQCVESDVRTACSAMWGRAASSPGAAQDLGSSAVTVVVTGPVGQLGPDQMFPLLTGLVVDAIFAHRVNDDGTPVLAPAPVPTVVPTPELTAVAESALAATSAQLRSLLTPGPEAAAAVAATHVADGPEAASVNEIAAALQQSGAVAQIRPGTTFRASVEHVEIVDGTRADVWICLAGPVDVLDPAAAPAPEEELAPSPTQRLWYDLHVVEGAWRLYDTAVTGDFEGAASCPGAPATPLAEFVEAGAPAPTVTTTG